MIRANFLALVVACAVMLGACDSDTLAPSEVVGDIWSLVSLQQTGAAAIAVEMPSRYTVQFTLDGKLLVRSDCNSCGGPYSLSESSLAVGPLACTKAYCGDASLDASFTAILHGARSVTLSSSELAIRGDSGTLRLRK